MIDPNLIPPRPDGETGQPRPPHAPLEPGWRSTERAPHPRARLPQPPSGEGPILEWFQTTKTNAIMPGVVVSLIVVGYLTWRDWGFGWMSTWWLWLFVLVSLPFFYVALGGYYMSAGADWLNVRGSFLKTYELTSVEVTTGGGGSYYLDLKDRNGNEVQAQLGMIQQNRALWDLVYNGILHSVHRGHATTNRRALDRLQLMSPPTVTPR